MIDKPAKKAGCSQYWPPYKQRSADIMKDCMRQVFTERIIPLGGELRALPIRF